MGIPKGELFEVLRLFVPGYFPVPEEKGRNSRAYVLLTDGYTPRSRELAVESSQLIEINVRVSFNPALAVGPRAAADQHVPVVFHPNPPLRHPHLHVVPPPRPARGLLPARLALRVLRAAPTNPHPAAHPTPLQTHAAQAQAPALQLLAHGAVGDQGVPPPDHHPRA